MWHGHVAQICKNNVHGHTESSEQEDKVLTQYLFHSKSSKWESSDDLK